MGSIVCCYIATQSGIEGLPAILLCLVGGAVAGGLWSLISGLLKVYRGQNEMIITIMLNYVATLFMGVVYTDWLRDGSVPQTQAVPEATQLSRLFGLRVTSAFVIALAVGLLVYYFLFYTSKGFQLRAVGLNMTAAEFNGFAVKKYILMSFIGSGAIAGLVLHWPVPLVYALLKLDSPVKTILSLIRIKSGKWIRNVTLGAAPVPAGDEPQALE